MRAIWAAVALVGGASGACAQSLNVRTGGWDMTVKMSAGGQVREHKFKVCVTKEDIDAARAFQQSDDDCKQQLTTRTATRWAGTMTCTGSNSGKGTFDLQAPSPDRVTMKSSREGARNSGSLEMTGRFASASCKGYDD